MYVDVETGYVMICIQSVAEREKKAAVGLTQVK